MASKKKQLERQQRQIELLSHFEGDYYQEKKVGNEVYVKMWNGGTNKWQVAVFTPQSFKKYKSFEMIRDEVEELDTTAQEKIEWERPTLESVQNLTKQ